MKKAAARPRVMMAADDTDSLGEGPPSHHVRAGAGAGGAMRRMGGAGERANRGRHQRKGRTERAYPVAASALEIAAAKRRAPSMPSSNRSRRTSRGAPGLPVCSLLPQSCRPLCLYSSASPPAGGPGRRPRQQAQAEAAGPGGGGCGHVGAAQGAHGRALFFWGGANVQWRESLVHERTRAT